MPHRYAIHRKYTFTLAIELNLHYGEPGKNEIEVRCNRTSALGDCWRRCRLPRSCPGAADTQLYRVKMMVVYV